MSSFSPCATFKLAPIPIPIFLVSLSMLKDRHAFNLDTPLPPLPDDYFHVHSLYPSQVTWKLSTLDLHSPSLSWDCQNSFIYWFPTKSFSLLFPHSVSRHLLVSYQVQKLGLEYKSNTSSFLFSYNTPVWRPNSFSFSQDSFTMYFHTPAYELSTQANRAKEAQSAAFWGVSKWLASSFASGMISHRACLFWKRNCRGWFPSCREEHRACVCNAVLIVHLHDIDFCQPLY